VRKSFLNRFSLFDIMFYLTEIEDYVRVEPKLFGLDTLDAVKEQLKETYKDYSSRDLGKVLTVVDVLKVGKGVIIPGDGAAYYKSKFKLLVWKPVMQELTYGIISEIASFGSFIDMGGMRGMIHISQTMEDYVSFSKSNTLTGKKSKRTLKKGDKCLARIIAISYKPEEPKIGVTMRQPGLGKLEWIKKDKKKKKNKKKSESKEKKEKKK
jgi:DNA-directed RNA polymerase subunit E'